ncbi:NADP oxidoreductase [Lacibacter luteus]|uniref:NADP oxidoreductase n=1 Tax=Lacibacter luteus TaxID=2508719 RepID=A0A4Q1CHB9_9BACT|nr:NADPH-dependent F420 reductase [Lacibacter luteus]RXK59707.1 NADP oxidoreductase [Lacibacter luteus]
MQTKRTIAILGASGNMGSAIAKALAKGNDRLLLISKEEEKLEALKTVITNEYPLADIEGMTCAMHGSWEADIIILATPYEAQTDVAEKIREVASQKIVISIANPLNATYDALVTNPETSAAEELQALLPHSKVVKAFNTTYAANFAQTVIDGKQADAFIAGNNESALETTAELVKTTGFNPIIAGKLSVSRTLEAMQLLLIQLTMKYKYNWLAGWKILHQ